jgi:hypothetical protein
MATLARKIAAEQKVRELLVREDVPVPDRIEYGFDCVRLFWDKQEVVLVVELDEIGEESSGAGRRRAV